ncbi:MULTISPECIES: branched-chain amino acid ABC transporter permease [Paenibacillus]|uniref:Leucine/isoleucine/valine transporter permease n=1 Tax=Paenibacillus naphthalenovorans TaxID=162209 RepID=A0A0U2W6Y7_9BACL|nr:MULTISPECIES: branched-chain amino acid ABC transporter permease [Paenibacillus]ALS21162.1 leucine/isoleucine/valine transporter permease [Paenibacillus naphthalenovorans]SDI01305.1 branched-chain amino acid transport system permease protein [Paenibacillus naphthalenovorans]
MRLQKYYVAMTLGFVLLILPVFLTDKHHLNIAVMTLMYAALALFWNWVGGYTGQLSFAHIVFFGIGAYTSTLLFLHFNVSPWLGMLVGGILSSVIAGFLSYWTVRLKGPFFALATLALSQVSLIVAVFWKDLTGGSQGLSLPLAMSFQNMLFDSKAAYYFIICVLVLIGLSVSVRIENSRTGYLLKALKLSEAAAEAVGINSLKLKVRIMCLSAFFTSLAGTFYAQYIMYIDPYSVFNLELNILMILIVMIGGQAAYLGPMIGALLLVPVNEVLRSELAQFGDGIHGMLYGAILMLIIILAPQGVIGMLRKWNTRRLSKYQSE